MIELEKRRADWMRTPGWNASLRVGPLGFGICTADGWVIAFGVKLGRLELLWNASYE